ncbi:MAG TPA: hypothetical protein VJX95_05890 [Oscillospiraceae bacterium]|nr:hypothetical protein [Oscillospiraceae bacterium]
MKKTGFNYLIGLLGLLLLGAGLLMIKLISEPQGILLPLQYVLVGVGCGVFGSGIGNIVNNRVMRKNPDIKKKEEIEIRDERNIAVRNSAKAKAYDIMVFVFSALMLAFALMQVEVAPILMLVFAYLFVIGARIYYQVKFNKEM